MRARREAAGRASFARHSKQRNVAHSTDYSRKGSGAAPAQVRRVSVAAPKNLSLFGSYAETNQFLNTVRDQLSRGKRIFVDFSHTRELTVETVLVLLAIIKDIGGRKSTKRVRAVMGNFPLGDSIAGQILVQSGFFDHVASNLPSEMFDDSHGKMGTRKGYRVSTDLADGLAKKAANAVFGTRRHLPAVYRVFIELMGNTKQHANPRGNESERWWAMVFATKHSKSAQFAFYDAGVGIPASFRKRVAALLSTIGIGASDASLMRLLLEGRSRTELRYRGKGLPAVAKTLRRKQIDALKILTNGVMADVGQARFHELDEPFVGTLFSWELHPHNDHYTDQQ